MFDSSKRVDKKKVEKMINTLKRKGKIDIDRKK